MRETPNLSYIHELAEGSLEFERKIITIMKKEFLLEKKEFITNYESNNFQEAAENVHKLKHKIGMLGLEKGYKLAIAFEEELNGKNPLLLSKFMLILESMDKFLKTL